jgi:hypothetical protein
MISLRDTTWQVTHSSEHGSGLEIGATCPHPMAVPGRKGMQDITDLLQIISVQFPVSQSESGGDSDSGR